MTKRTEGMGTDDSLLEKAVLFIPGTEQLDITTHPYRLFIFKPNTTPPETGFPVMYVLDGNSLFGTMVEAIRLQSRRPEKQVSYLLLLLELAIRQKRPIIRLGIMISLLPALTFPLGVKERTSPSIHMAAPLLSFLFRKDG